MAHTKSLSRKFFLSVNSIILIALALLSILPFMNLLAVSLSSSTAVFAGKVKFIPVEFTLSSYTYVMRSTAFLTSFLVSIKRLIVGLPINLFLILFTAYPLSKEKEFFRLRGVYAWFFIITMLFSGGLIPTYIIIKNLGLIDKIWSLVLPEALPIFSMIVMLNFFRRLPKELEEAAFIDGASHWNILWKIFVPLSKPCMATVALFSIVFHWNSWFDGMIYMNRPANYPLQSYLQTIITNPEKLIDKMTLDLDVSSLLQFVNNNTAKAAQLFIATIPIIIAYPFLQKYFTTGLVIGSVKE